MGSINLQQYKGKIKSDFRGFSELIRVFDKINRSRIKRCHINFEYDWFDSNMCSPLGAILDILLRKGINISFDFEFKIVKESLTKNRFLEKFLAFPPIKDIYPTTIEYERFKRTEIRAFKSYIEKQFIGKGLPEMTPAAQKKFRECISELFENAVAHSKTKHGIYVCGQHFPKKRKLNFSVTDAGLGMKNVVNEHTGQNLDALEAIWWATTGDHTTRTKDKGKPGGLGLKLLKEFINLNGGSIQIVSDKGFWKYYNNGYEMKYFDMPFPGTSVNIEINTADSNSYCLDSEINPDDIF